MTAPSPEQGTGNYGGDWNGMGLERRKGLVIGGYSARKGKDGSKGGGKAGRKGAFWLSFSYMNPSLKCLKL